MQALDTTSDKPLSGLSRLRFALRRRAGANELRQTMWVVFDQGVVSLASFITTVIVGRTCGREELGIYVLATTTFWLLAGIPNALTWTPFTSRAPRMSTGRRAGYCGSITLHTFLLTAFLAGVFIFVGLLPSSWFGQTDWFSWMCFALVPFTLMMTLREHVRRICMAQVAVRDLLTLDAPIAVAQLVLLLWLAHKGWLTANTALVAVAVACFVSVLWLVGHRSHFAFRRRRAAVHWSYNLQFGRWLLALSIVWLLSDSLYRWIVGWQYGLDGLGRFASASDRLVHQPAPAYRH